MQYISLKLDNPELTITESVINADNICTEKISIMAKKNPARQVEPIINTFVSYLTLIYSFAPKFVPTAGCIP